MNAQVEVREGKEIILREIEEMKRHKWIESEKAGQDLGDKALFEWIDSHEEGFLGFSEPN